jgi:two-component system, cell cycle response regulator DivK
MHILVVDDVEDSREVIGAMLEMLGHRVSEAAGGKEAIHFVMKENPELILMDLSMPEVDGLLAVRALRQIEFSSRIPVIAVTAYPESVSLSHALAAGCDGYLRKPVTPEDLSDVLNRFDPPRH